MFNNMVTRGSYSRYDQIQLNLAVHAYESTPNASIRAVAAEYDVPRATLHAALHNGDFDKPGHEAKQRATKFEGQIVVNWIIGQDRIEWPPTVAQIRRFATYILESLHVFNSLGINWIEGFKRRNPGVTTMIGRKIYRERRDGTSTEALNSFFQKIKHVKDE